MHVKIRFLDLLLINSWTATLLRTLIWDIQVVLCRMVSASNLFWKSKNKQAVPLMRAETHHPSCSRWIRWKIWTPFLVKCSLQWRRKLCRNAMSTEHQGAIVHTTGSISEAPLWPKVGSAYMCKKHHLKKCMKLSSEANVNVRKYSNKSNTIPRNTYHDMLSHLSVSIFLSKPSQFRWIVYPLSFG